eukprot:9807710-Ditylum_brightwellii.AAC.1
MKEAAEHVPFQLPNELTRVGFLLMQGCRPQWPTSRAMMIWHQRQARGTTLSWLPITLSYFVLS